MFLKDIIKPKDVDIAKLVHKSEAAIKKWKTLQPDLYEIAYIGATLKINNIPLQHLLILARIHNELKNLPIVNAD